MPTGVYKRTEENKVGCFKKGHTAWNKGRKGRQRNHNISGLTKKGGTPWNKGSRCPSLSGSNHWNWKTDRTKVIKKEKRNDPAYKSWRAEVYRRDNHVCRIANKDCKGKIVAHHILGWRDYPELRYQSNNGITLCHFHHPKRREEEKRLSPYFQDLVSVSSATICH